MMDLGERISALRKDNGLSQEAFAEALGVSRQAVSKWESGASTPDPEKLLLLSTQFGVSTDYLLKGEDPPQAKAEAAPEAEAPLSEKATQDTEAPTYDLPPRDASAYTLFDTPEDTFQPDDGTAPARKKSGRRVRRIISLALAACLLVGAVALPLAAGGIKEAWWLLWGGKVQYPYVLVHGLGGWGSDSALNDTASYWGASGGDLVKKLTDEGYAVCAPSVGPVSSTWDRACELYAQLTGTTVDYGAAHAALHKHERFGRSYDTPLAENWGTLKNGGQRVKINLVGHSFGGATVRLLTSLLAEGAAEEIAATGSETSPLFTGGKANWVHSVTTLCAPHNGSSLTAVIDTLGSVVGIGNSTQLLSYLLFAAAGVATPIAASYDFMLDQFGISAVDGTVQSVQHALQVLTAKGSDHAGYDLSPDGAAALNARISTVKGVYYFSYAYCTTHAGTLLDVQVPNADTLPVLIPTATAMGIFQGATPGGIVISTDWQPNDGLVSVVSAQHPNGAPFAALPAQAPEAKTLSRGIWYVAETREGDHGTVIGLNADAQETLAFWNAQFARIEALKR